MVGDITWLSAEARSIHQIFSSMFYGLVLTFLLIGLVVEYFKWPLGHVPSFGQLVGRAIIASILLQAYPEISNALANVVDATAERIGEFNNFRLVLDRMSEKLDTLSYSWVSVKESVVIGVSFISFFALYFSIYIAEGILIFTWLLSYVFSPILIALFVLPATSGATRALFRTLIEVSCWKIVWAVLAALLWSLALSEANSPKFEVNLLSVVCLNLTLASSIVLTPWIVHLLADAGLAGFPRTLGGLVVGSQTITPARAYQTTKTFTQHHIVDRVKSGRSMKQVAAARAKEDSRPNYK